MVQGKSVILVIDDDEDIRDCMRSALVFDGYEVCLVENGPDALRMLQNGSCTPALIIVDEYMVPMNGQTFIRVLAEAGLRTMPVILFSADHTIPKMCASCEADACLLKPFELDDLLSMVADLLARKKVKQLV